MKRIIIALSIFALLVIPGVVLAQGEQQGQQQNRIQDPTTHPDTITPQDSQVQNQNQVNTQNQGDDSQLQVRTQEQESLGDRQGEGLQNRNQNAVESMSEVAKQVQQLLQARTEGGIGQQVRQIAQEQNQAQAQIQEQLYKLESKGKLARLLTGTDYKAVKNLKAQLVQNQLRIKQLEQLITQLSNQGDITTVQATIVALVKQNTALQEQITAEEGTKSLFGWLFRFFA